MKFNLQPRAKTGVGLVTDATGCELAILTLGHPRPRIIKREAPRPGSTDGAVARAPLSAAQWLGQLKPEFARARYRLATLINSRDVFTKRISLPSADPNEIGTMVQLQVEKLCPLPLDEVVWSCEVLGSGDGKSDVLLVFARKDSLIQRATDFGDEFVPDLIDVDLMVLWRALRDKRVFEGKNCCGLLWIDPAARAAKWMLMHGSKPLAIEHLPVENVDAASLAHSLSNFLLSAEANLGEGPIEDIFLFGPPEIREELSVALLSALGARITPIDATPDLSPAAGLAQRALRNGHVQVNLLPVDFVQRQQKKLFRQQAKRVVAIALAVYIVAMLGFFAAIKWRQHAVKRIDKVLASKNDDFLKAQARQAEVRFLEQKLDDKRSALEVLRVISENLMALMSIQNFTYKQPQGAEVRGTAAGDSDVYALMRKLEATKLFGEIKSGSIKVIPGRGAEVSFDITCNFNPPPPPGRSR